jgi:hypothetical protein
MAVILEPQVSEHDEGFFLSVCITSRIHDSQWTTPRTKLLSDNWTDAKTEALEVTRRFAMLLEGTGRTLDETTPK